MLVWELIGAVVGAGLASGREIASFFSTFEKWSLPGIFLSVAVMASLTDTVIPTAWHNTWKEKGWSLLLSLLLVVTGGAMLSGAGEAVALMLPIHGAYWIGQAITLLLAWLLARRTVSGLALVSRALTAVLISMMVLGLFMPGLPAAVLADSSLPAGTLRAITYGGFNAALQVPIMSASCMDSQRKRRTAWSAAALIAAVLLLGNAVLLRHPAMIGEPLPFVRLMAALGKPGFWISAACIYLAILSTLTACIRGSGGGFFPAAGMIVVALGGFSGAVGVLYPMLGGACFLMLLLAKLSNSHINSFLSRQDML